jgi:hypothetical protein
VELTCIAIPLRDVKSLDTSSSHTPSKPFVSPLKASGAANTTVSNPFFTSTVTDIPDEKAATSIAFPGRANTTLYNAR